MLESLFSFHGRLTRLGFFGLAILLTVLTAVDIGLMVFVAAKLVSGKGAVAAGLGSIVLLLLGLLPLFWANLAICARRLRDAGFPPVLVIPAMMAFALIDHFVIGPALGGAGRPYVPHGSLFGFCVQVIYAGILLFWPSTGGGETGRPMAPLRLPPAPAPEPVFVAPMAMAPAAPSVVFGRRRS